MPTPVTEQRPKLLIFVGAYLPGFRGGGPIQSVAGFVDNFGEEIEIRIVTSDRDLGDTHPYPEITPWEWQTVGKAKVLYADIANLSFSRMHKIISSFKPDAIYLNSFFSFSFSIKPLLLLKFANSHTCKVLLAPRGELTTGAMSLKSTKKRLFIFAAKVLGLHSNIQWHATAEQECIAIKEVYGGKLAIKVAPPLRSKTQCGSVSTGVLEKKRGELKIVFASRISRKKNLHAAFEFLREVSGNVLFTVVGPPEDSEYTNLCNREASRMPPNVRVNFTGGLRHDEVLDKLRENHVFILPTLNENYGHAILEAFLAGCIPIISDQTPWRDLASQKIGWDLPLSQPSCFIRALQECVDMTNEEWRLRSDRVRDWAGLISRDAKTLELNKELLLGVLSNGGKDNSSLETLAVN